jgi:hypothetical protein
MRRLKRRSLVEIGPRRRALGRLRRDPNATHRFVGSFAFGLETKNAFFGRLRNKVGINET